MPATPANPATLAALSPRERVLRSVRCLVAGLALMAPAAWNGVPLMYPDTPTYLRGAEAAAVHLLGPGRLAPWLPQDGTSLTPRGASPTESEPAYRVPPAPRARGLSAVSDQVVLAGRSVYYGALLEASHLAGSLWWAVAFQALCVAWLLQLLWVDAWRLPTGGFVPVVAGLAWATPLGLYTGLLMPDIYAGLAVLASVILMVYGRGLRAGQALGVALLLLFALTAHNSHLAVVTGLLLLTATAPWWMTLGRGGARSTPRPADSPDSGLRASAVWPSGLAWVAVAILLAWLAEAGFARAVERAVGAPPLRLPHLTARLVDAGPGTEYLQRQCPRMPQDRRWAACEALERYPMPWTDFLFEADPRRGVFAPADAASKRRLSEEQLSLAWSVLRDAPGAVLADLAADVPRQLLAFRIDIWGLGPRELAMYQGRVPASLMDAMVHSLGARHPEWQTLWSALTLASVTGGAVVLAGLMLRGRPRSASTGTRTRAGAGDGATARVSRSSALLLTGVVLNAAVCGLLASPLDRFQARIVWLVPLLAAGWLLARRSERRSPPISAPAPTASWPQAGKPEGSTP
jgi:hypothetical protein